MCLSSVKESYENPSDVIQSGYKVFNGTLQAPRFQNQKLKGTMDVPLDTWFEAEETRIKASDGRSYTTGFHIYVDEKDAKKMASGGISTRVYFKKAHTLGYQDGEIYIAKQMYVPSDSIGWPPKPGDPKPEPPKKKANFMQKITGKEGNA